MTNRDNRPMDAADLRQKAEAFARQRAARTPEDSAALSPEEVRKTLYELRVHQIELEMQNEELRTAQARIEAGRARYFDLYDLAPVGYCTLSEQGLILEANLTAAALLGTTRGELIKQPISRFILEEDQDIYYLHRKKLFETGEPQECELRLVKPDGASFWAHLTATAAQSEDGAPVCLCVINDITERKQAEEELRESEARFRHLLQSVPNIAAQGYGPDGTTRYWNEASEHLYGYTAQEAIGRNLIDLIIPTEMRGEVEQAIHQMAETGQPIPASELSLLRKDGSRVSVFSSHATVQIPGQAPELFCIDIDITERKRAEDKLRDSELFLHTTINSLKGHICVLDETGKIVLTNQAWDDFAIANGGDPQCVSEGVNYLSVCDSVTGPDLESASSCSRGIRAVLSGDSPEFSMEYPCHSPTEKGWFLGKASPLQRKDSRWVVINHENITERKQAEEELKRSREKFVLAVKGSNDGIWDWNLLTNEVFFSEKWKEQLGYADHELENNFDTFENLLHPDDKQSVLDFVKRYLEGQIKVYSIELRMRHKDGSYRWILARGEAIRDEDGKPFRMAGSHSDITERKQAEEVLKEANRELQASQRAALNTLEELKAENQLRKAKEAELERMMMAIEQAGEVIMITDPAGMIQYLNPAFETVTGYAREEAVGKTPGILKSGRQDQTFYQNLWQTITSGRIWQGRMVNKRKDGTLYTQDGTISPVFDAAGKIINYVGVKRDVTAHLELTAQLQQAQKMESIGRLAGGVAHDFNNKLSVILGYTQMVMESLGKGDPKYGDLQEVMDAGQQSVAIVRQLLAFARKQIIAPEVLELNETVQDMLKMLRRFIGEDIDLVWSPGHDLWQVKMDPSQLDQILANLCVNARDAIEGSGKVAIETENRVLDRGYCDDHPGCSPGEYVMLAVTDNGCGMDRETLTYAFEPFFTTKEVGKGTGLGLATVYGIVKQNQGHIDVVSEPGKGASFKICLPRHIGGAEEGIEAAQKEAPRGRGETILVVEDDPAVLQLGKRILERLGYAVLTSASPAEAVNLAREYADEIHLLMTDVVLPGMNGRDLAGEISKIRPNIKTMFMSGYTAEIIARQGVLDKGVQFIEKPFSPDSLARKVREALGTRSAELGTRS